LTSPFPKETVTVPPGDGIVFTPEDVPAAVVVVVSPGAEVDGVLPGVEVDEVVPGVDVDDVVATVVDVEEGDPSTVDVLVVGTISGAPDTSLTSPDAAATTHQAARVTRTVANSHPRTYLVVLICSSSLKPAHVGVSEASRFS
jgi:hypothetical protein